MQDRIDGLEKAVGNLATKSGEMQTKITVMSTHIEYLRDEEEARGKRVWAIFMTAAGAIVASFIGWIVSGGMNVK